MRIYLLQLMTLLLLGVSITSTAINPLANKKNNQTIKVALLLDTSNSMDGLINQAKAQLWEIVNELSYAKYGIQKPDLEIALYEYGNDHLESSDGFVRLVLAFNSDLDEISEKLFSLTTNGGKEYCGQVISASLKELAWGENNNDLRLIFIAGNEPFTQGKINYKEAISDAKEKDVIINTIFCGNYIQGISEMWKEGANLGGGDYMTINQNKKVIHIITPYDNDIIILNKKLNKTYIYFGNKGAVQYEKQAMQDKNATKFSSSVSVGRAISKSNRFYKNSSWDLIDKSEDEIIDYSEIKRIDLPKDLQKMSDIELKGHVEKLKEERLLIKKRVNQLDKKRRTFIAKKQQKSTKENELESVIINAIKKQATKKNYYW
ncbi:MAG: VWA domain-containing protein [Flavobacterium sp.]|jgi:hypothetical protein|nr:VWA domain-containing protein [Flavobacterium sp.]